MITIPKIIHQFPVEFYKPQSTTLFLSLSETWQTNHLEWEYKLWDKVMIENYLRESFPVFYLKYAQSGYNKYYLNHIARYFILFKEGGLFVDYDYECIEPFDDIIGGKECIFSLSPSKNAISNSLMISSKQHSFLAFIISNLNNIYGIDEFANNSFINKVYNKYDNKESLSILPFQLITPCTEDEIKLYQHGLMKDEDMEEKISEAISICHYNKEKETIGIDKQRTDLLYINPIVEYGGAPRSAYRIHLGLRKIGINSKMLVLESNLDDWKNTLNGIYIIKPGSGKEFGYRADIKILANYPNRDKTPHTFAPALTGVNINKYISEFNPKIIQLHWVNAGLIKIEDLGTINRKIVWRLPDCWAITGGCFYFGKCTRYLLGCGKCPRLGSNDEYDLSHSVWKRKEKAWKKMDMTIVVPTLWMKKAIINSTLLGNREVHIIPNGLDLDEFYPIEKRTAKKALNIPLNKRVILFGATNAINDLRKGFSLLLNALQSLSPYYQNEYYLLIFGADSQPIDVNIENHFLGYVDDNYILQLAYSAADVMVVSSLEEAFGQTVIEAMACATPVVSFRETGPEGIIDHTENGYLANYADVMDLANGIKWVLTSEKRISLLSDNARHKVETTYDIKFIAQQYKELYQKLNMEL